MTATLTYPISDSTRAFLDRALLGHVIGEGPCPSVTGDTMPVIDPATGQEIAVVAAGSAADVDRAVEQARQAFEDGRWRRLAAFEKERRLRRLYDLVGEHATLLAELDVIDLGVPKVFADWMVAIALECIGYYAGWPSKLDGTVHPSSHDLMVYSVREPIGVCAGIIPWTGRPPRPCGRSFPPSPVATASS